jgi:hypothetical protein
MKLTYTALTLYTPLYYDADPGLRPFQYYEGEEIVMAFELDAETGRSIEPEIEHYLSEPLWLGRRGGARLPEALSARGGMFPGVLCMPAGLYFFSQIRETLDRRGWIECAVEVQKEALWQRHRLGGRLYLRSVYEDGAAAAQIFRACL